MKTSVQKRVIFVFIKVYKVHIIKFEFNGYNAPFNGLILNIIVDQEVKQNYSCENILDTKHIRA